MASERRVFFSHQLRIRGFPVCLQRCTILYWSKTRSRVPCHSVCDHFVHVLCARLSILMAVLIICCASPPAWLFARLSVRGGAAGSAGRVVPGTQPRR